MAEETVVGNTILKLGDHRITKADINHKVVLNSFKAAAPINVFYSDPPWGDGNLKYWVTMNKKMNPDLDIDYEPLVYADLLNRIRVLIEASVDGLVFLESGLQWKEMVGDMLSQYLQNIVCFDRTYASGSKQSPNICFVAGTSKKHKFNPSVLTTTHDFPIVNEIIKVTTKPGQVVADPCCGMGWTAQAAINHGCNFIGNEFNEKRLLKTLKRFK